MVYMYEVHLACNTANFTLYCDSFFLHTCALNTKSKVPKEAHWLVWERFIHVFSAHWEAVCNKVLLLEIAVFDLSFAQSDVKYSFRPWLALAWEMSRFDLSINIFTHTATFETCQHWWKMLKTICHYCELIFIMIQWICCISRFGWIYSYVKALTSLDTWSFIKVAEHNFKGACNGLLLYSKITEVYVHRTADRLWGVNSSALS